MKKILIVEDELSMVKGLKDNLEYEGYDVDTAMEGRGKYAYHSVDSQR
ncbi:MAG: hypothetical protein ABSF81_10050 [Bacteroidales bacterium]|jgi:DNA-binding response OmpR family regulator